MGSLEVEDFLQHFNFQLSITHKYVFRWMAAVCCFLHCAYCYVSLHVHLALFFFFASLEGMCVGAWRVGVPLVFDKPLRI